MPGHDERHGWALSPALTALAAKGRRRSYRKGTVLIEEGDRGDTLFVILAGRLRAYSVGEREREITYGVYGPGEYLGEMSLDGGPRSASVVTLEASVCAVIDRPLLMDHLRSHPEFALELLAKVIRRARAATLSTKSLALNDVYGRLVALLTSMARQPAEGGPPRVEERPTHQEIAYRLGCSREMVSRLLKDLEQGEYLRFQPDRIELLRPLPARW